MELKIVIKGLPDSTLKGIKNSAFNVGVDMKDGEPVRVEWSEDVCNPANIRILDAIAKIMAVYTMQERLKMTPEQAERYEETLKKEKAKRLFG